MPFVPRLTDAGMLNNPYWYSQNPFWMSGYGLPNCTCYAWGRMWELSGIKPTQLYTGNAEDWYYNTPVAAFQKSPLPVLGAILCLYGPGDYAGHVAVVEQIAANGDITVSESAYRGDYFRTAELKASANYLAPWAQSRGYIFQGFLLPPAYASGGTPGSPLSWHARAQYAYADTDQEAIENARIIYYLLWQRGWTLNAVCGLLGNFSIESGMNPWIWQGNVVLSSTDPNISISSSHAYGLPQFDPAGKYINSPYAQGYTAYAPNFSDIPGRPEDGEAQIIFIDEHADYLPTAMYPVSYADYKISTDSPETCAAIWVYNYERPGSYSHVPERQQHARYWYDLLFNLPLIPPTQKKIRKMPLWMMLPPAYHEIH